ncbi:unnamed protein product, partial [Mesorhabditis spiculigera]
MIGCVGQEVVAGLSCAGALETSRLNLPTCDQSVHDGWLFVVLGSLIHLMSKRQAPSLISEAEERRKQLIDEILSDQRVFRKQAVEESPKQRDAKLQLARTNKLDERNTCPWGQQHSLTESNLFDEQDIPIEIVEEHATPIDD